MTNLEQLPPEREMPADRQARMRRQVLDTLTAPARPAHRRGRAARVVVASLATAACLAAAVSWAGGLREHPKPEVVALGDSALSPLVRETGNLCLTHAKTMDPARWPTDSSRPVMVNYAERDGTRAIVIYRMGERLYFCSMEPTTPPSDEWSSSLGSSELPTWLPGPISAESASSSEPWGGESALAGFVSRRVAKVILDHGNGHHSTARLANGTFVVVSEGDVADRRGELISYDDQGREIDRRPAFDLGPVGTSCWVDPQGTVVLYGKEVKDATAPPSVNCGKAEPWAAPTD